MASGYFPRLYAVFPRPNAAFASSRRAAAGSGAAAARPPPIQPGNDVGNAVVTSVASTAAATARPVLPIAATITRAHVVMEYLLALLVDASVPFCAATSARGRCFHGR